MIYYGILVFLSCLIYCVLRAFHWKKAQINKITLTFFFVMYFLLLCCRSTSVGNDTLAYVKAFQYARMVGWKASLKKGSYEIGFLVFRQILAEIGGSRLFICVTAAVTVFPVLYLYKKETEDSIFCIAFFLISLLFEFFFSGMRQGIAIALAVPAFYMVKERKLVPFLIIVVLACTFHRSAILLFALYPAYYAKITKKWLWFVLPAILIIFLERNFLLKVAIQLAGSEYAYNYAYLTGSSSQRGLMILFILLSIYSYVMLDEKQAGVEEIGLRNILLLATCIHLFTPLHPTISRLNYYFILFIPLAITRINNRVNHRFRQIERIAAIVMPAFFIMYFFVAKTDSLNVFDYKTFF